MRSHLFTWVIMTTVVLTLSGASPAASFAQNMSKKYAKETLASRFQQLSKDFNINIGFRPEQCQIEIPEMELTNATIEDALNKSLANTIFKYRKESDKSFIITNKETTSPQQRGAPGNIKGRIVETGTNEPLIGATVRLLDTDKGTMTNLDGYYSLENIPSGKYTMEIAYMGYETKQITVTITANRTLTEDITLAVDNKLLDEVVVTGVRRERGSVPHATVSQVTQEIKELTVVASGISSEQISRSADRNAAQAVQRVSGVSIVDDKFVVVRGLNQRYNLTYLNDNVAPATEVYSRSFALDLIPSRVIDKIIVLKSSGPDNQADATGGVVKVFTKDAQAVKHLDIDVQGAFRTGSTFKDMLGHKGGKWDWLGFDDGMRKLPSVVPGYGSTDVAKISQADYVRGFSPYLWHSQSKAMPNVQMTINYYDVFNIGKRSISSLTSFNYKHEEEVSDIFRQQGIGKYTGGGDADDKISWDVQGKQTSQLNLLQNFTLRLGDNHRFQFKNFLLQTGTSTNTERVSFNHGRWSLLQREGRANPFKRNLDVILSYRQRFLYAGNLSGNHAFGNDQRHQLKWSAGYSYTLQSVPDQRVVRYVSPYNTAYGDKDLQYTAVIRQGDLDFKSVLFGSVSRTWMRNTDDLYNISADYKFKPAPWVSLGVGTFQQFKRRHFYRRVYTVNEGDLTGTADDYNTRPGYAGFINPDLIQFNRNNITEVWSEKYLRDDRTGLKVYDRTQGSDAYVGTEQNNAGYASFSLTPWDGKLEVHGGVRAEYNKQAIGAAIPPTSSGNFTNVGKGINTPIYTEYGKLDWFPSLSVNVKPNDLFILRGGYSRTVNRPEFRETSPFEETDYEGNQIIMGNPALRPSLSDNWDARLEFYPRDNQKGESVSIGFFHKSMTNPIERINTSFRNAGGNISTRISFNNAEKATIKGVEIEATKSLDFIPVVPFKQLSVGLNLSFIQSRVTQDSVHVYGGSYVNIDRRLQGQAPFLLNAGLYYDNPGSGTKASLIYNMVGERIYAASIGYADVPEVLGFQGGLYRGSLIELPRHMLDFSITQRIAKGLQAKLSVQNLLNKPVEMAEDFNFTYKYEPYRDMKPEEYTSEDLKERWREEGDNISSRFNPGRYFSLSVSYSF